MQPASNATTTKALEPDTSKAGEMIPRKGGLIAMPKHVMTPVFALLVFFLALDVLTIVVPFFAFRFTDNAWGSAERMEFLAKAMASGLAFGFVASIAAERRNHSPWGFLIGHAGFWLAIALALFDWDLEHGKAAPLIVVMAGFVGCVVVLIMTSRKAAEPPPVRGLLRALCLLTGRVGNIWFGLALMATIAISVGSGTIIESMYTARSAQHYVYRAPWFGAVFFTAGLSMLCATFRKWPFRLEQAGWLTVHTGLAMVVIGSMTSFLTTVEGEVQIKEGQRIDAFQLSTRTRFSVSELVGQSNKKTAEPVINEVSDFDLNPADKEINRVYKANGAPLTITIDRYYANTNYVPAWRDDGDSPRAGALLDVFIGGSKTPELVELDEGDEDKARTRLPFRGMDIPVEILTGAPRLFDALVREKPVKDHGRIVLRDRAGKAVLEMPVEPAAGAESRPQGLPAALNATAEIPGTPIKVHLRGYYDMTVFNQGKFLDASPGMPANPAVALSLEGPEGEDARQVRAFFDDPLPPPSEMPKGRYPYETTYAFEPSIEMEGPQLILMLVGDQLRFVWYSRDGGRTSGVVQPGVALPLPMPVVRIVPKATYKQLRVEEMFEFRDYAPERSAIRLFPTWDGVAGEALWLPLGASRVIEHGDRHFALSWRATSRPLGFSLGLYDFHRDFHPGSMQPSTFESYLRLVHAGKFPEGEDIKIDMNHPLRLDGWRLYQARFGENDESTILQVNRDPGLAITYPACAVVLLGLIVVFFMKKSLVLVRKNLEREGATPMRHLMSAVAAVAAVGIGPALFSVYVAIRPFVEQHLGFAMPLSGWPAFVFGLSFVVLFPIMVVVWFTRSTQKKLGPAEAGHFGARA